MSEFLSVLAACTAESDSDEIGLSGTEKFCEDLGVEPSDIIVLIIAWCAAYASLASFIGDARGRARCPP
eukprot:1391033-Pleurochrysis_carterae.AAC.2